MKKKIILMVAVVTFGLMAAVRLSAQSSGGSAGQPSAGCCGGMGPMGASCDMHVSSLATRVTVTNPVVPTALMQPVQSVFDNYLKVQTALSRGSFPDALKAAAGMAKAIQGDSMTMLPSPVAQQIEAVGGAKDLEATREAFKPLSQSLIQYLKAQKVPAGTYHEVYCPMAGASWLQTGKTVANPYFGPAMFHCGQFKN